MNLFAESLAELFKETMKEAIFESIRSALEFKEWEERFKLEIESIQTGKLEISMILFKYHKFLQRCTSL